MTENAVAAADRPTVLVTGGTGYLAKWIIAGLLERGHRVRATVRDLGRADQVRRAVAERTDPGGLTFVQADLLADSGWDEALSGVRYVQHVASPLPTDPSQDLVRTAREGVRRVLAAAGEAGVRRVVFTSSGVAARPPHAGDVYDETVWTDLDDGSLDAYARAKTQAERDAWALAGSAGSPLELVTVLAGFILGPALGREGGISSVDIVRRLLAGEVQALPNIGWEIVDVRDLADLHIRAMTAPEAAGQRFLAVGEFLWLRDIAAALREELPGHAGRIPTSEVPDDVVRLAAETNADMALPVPFLGRRGHADGSKAGRVLGWRTRPARESVVDAARGLIAHGVVDGALQPS
jgi:nucleoside-diphosphate-sugar epimerase